jgi:hypothetical protein
MGRLFRVALSTNTCVYPPTTTGAARPCSNTPTSYATELSPSFAKRSPSSSAAGKPVGAKNCACELTTSPMSSVCGGVSPQCAMR